MVCPFLYSFVQSFLTLLRDRELILVLIILFPSLFTSNIYHTSQRRIFILSLHLPELISLQYSTFFTLYSSPSLYRLIHLYSQPTLLPLTVPDCRTQRLSTFLFSIATLHTLWFPDFPYNMWFPLYNTKLVPAAQSSALLSESPVFEEPRNYFFFFAFLYFWYSGS